MQYTLTINQVKAMEWGLNLPQANVFAFVYTCPSWCRPVMNDRGVFYALSKQKIVDELPMVTNKPDTAFRILKQLEKLGVIELSSTNQITLVRLTEKGRTWNHQFNKDGWSEKSPTKNPNINPTDSAVSRVGNISDLDWKNIRPWSEIYPTNQYTNNSLSEGERTQVDFDDAGQPITAVTENVTPLSKFSMHRDWQPDTNALTNEFYRRGMGTNVQFTAADLADFTAHYADMPGQQKSESAWTALFAKWVQSNRRREQQVEQARQQRQASQEQRTANRIASTEGNHHANRRPASQQNYDPHAARARARAQQQQNDGMAGRVYEGQFVESE